jgi:hypothetical protein
MKQSLAFVFFFFLLALQVNAQQSVGYSDNWWRPNGNVYKIVQSGNKVFIAGDFDYIGPDNPHGNAVNINTGLADSNFQNPNDIVRVCIPDGAGGWYIGGDFTTIGNQPRYHIARINADGSLNPWDPNSNNSVYSLTLYGGRLYVTGNFTNIGGQTRNYIAALDTSTGNATAWNPNANNYVYTLAPKGNILYVGGEFTSIGGQTRYYVAALDSTTGNASTWNPIANGIVGKIIISGEKVYLAGNFTVIGGQSRMHLAAINTNTAIVAAWNPNSDPYSNAAIAITGGTIYAYGRFITIGGQTRKNLAALDTVNGYATAWNPNPDSIIYAVNVSNGLLYVGGFFSNIGGQSRKYLAALDTATGNATSFETGILNGSQSYPPVYCISLIGNRLYVGGDYIKIGGQNRNGLAAYNVTTGELTSWNPNPNSSVNALAENQGSIYIGGNFTNIGGQTRNHIAAVDTNMGAALSWNPNANSTVYAIEISGGLAYVGGYFTSVNSVSRNYVAAIDIVNGNVATWNPNANNVVNYIKVHGNTVYIVGGFTTVGAANRKYLAGLDIITGSASSLNPNPDNIIKSIAINNHRLYIGGSFMNICNVQRPSLVAVDSSTGLVSSWNPHPNGVISALALKGGNLYAAGLFDSIGGQHRPEFGAIDTFSATATAWNPFPFGDVNALLASGNFIYAGGSFTNMAGNYTRQYFMQLYDSTLLSVPTISSFFPTSGCSGDTVTITGNKFTGATKVWFGGVPATSFVVVSSTTIKAVLGTSASGTIAVTTPFGSAISVGSYTINNPLAIISPPNASAICSGSSLVIHANSGVGYSYQWKNNGVNILGATDSTYTTATAGAYSVTVTYAGCSTTSSIKNIFIKTVPPANITPGGSTSLCQGNHVMLNANGGVGYSYQWQNNGTNISGATYISYQCNTPGNYSVIVKDNTVDCSDTSSPTAVSVFPLPADSVTTSGPTTFCSGDSVVLHTSIGTGYTYQWMNGSNVISGATDSSYTINYSGVISVVVSDTNGCSATSVNTNVTSFPAVTVSIFQFQDTLKSFGSVGNYQWYFNGSPIAGAHSDFYIPSQSGDYYLVVSDTNGCSGVSNTFSFIVGIIEVSENYLLQIAPNPVTDILHITAPQAKTIEVVDVLGRIICQQSHKINQVKLSDEGKFQIDISGLSAGVYLVGHQKVVSWL